MQLTRRSDGILWVQIARTLEAEIRSRQREPGERVETESTLAHRFGVNRHTVRRALLSLQDEGLITTEQGRGSFVAEPMVDYALGPRTRFKSIIEKQSLTPSRVLLGIARKPATAVVAAALGVEAGAPVVEIESLGHANGRPTGIGIHHFDEGRFPGIAESYRETRSVTLALARFGVTDYFRKESAVTAVMPTARDARLLLQSMSRPLLIVEGVNVDAAGEPVEYSVSRMPTKRMRIVVSLPETGDDV